MIRHFVQQLCAAALIALALGVSVQAAPDPLSAWNALTPLQKEALAPLQKDWPSIDAQRRQKWLEVASRFPKMPADERARVQQRMAEWARLTPAERAQARLQFQEARQIPAGERAAKWEAYRALPEAERQSLAQRASPAGKAQSPGDSPVRPRPTGDPAAVRANGPSPSASANGRVTPPIVVQARPGATTTTMSVKPPQPSPVKQPQGAPKIAATSKHVDPATLLPRRSAPDGASGGASASNNAAQP